MAYKHRSNIIVRCRDWYLTTVKWRKYQFGAHFHAGRNVSLWARKQIKIGDYCYLGANTRIQCDTIMGHYVFTANNVAFVGKYDHHYQEPGKPMLLSSRIKDDDYNWKGTDSAIIIEDDVWIGYGAILMSGIRIGTGSIIASGALVTKDVESFSIYGGTPAVKIGDRFCSMEDLEKHKQVYRENYKTSEPL